MIYEKRINKKLKGSEARRESCRIYSVGAPVLLPHSEQRGLTGGNGSAGMCVCEGV